MTIAELPTFAGRQPTFEQTRQRAAELVNEALNLLMADCRQGAGPSRHQVREAATARRCAVDVLAALRRAGGAR